MSKLTLIFSNWCELPTCGEQQWKTKKQPWENVETKPKDQRPVSGSSKLLGSFFGIVRPQYWTSPSENYLTSDLKALNVLHYCSYSSPLIFPPLLPHIPITLPSCCPFSTLSLAVSHTSLLWCRCPFLSCRRGFTCPLALSFSPSGLDEPLSLVFVSSVSNPPPQLTHAFFPLSLLLRPVHLWISIHVSNLGDSTDTSTPLTSPYNAAYHCWCQLAAHSSRAAKAKRSGVKGHRRHSQSGQWGWKVSEGLSPGLREESGFITDESQEVKDDDITWEAEEGEGEPGRVRITDER